MVEFPSPSGARPLTRRLFDYLVAVRSFRPLVGQGH